MALEPSAGTDYKAGNNFNEISSSVDQTGSVFAESVSSKGSIEAKDGGIIAGDFDGTWKGKGDVVVLGTMRGHIDTTGFVCVGGEIEGTIEASVVDCKEHSDTMGRFFDKAVGAVSEEMKRDKRGLERIFEEPGF